MDKTKIDWCDSTWNPVTGCLHGCEYCYARKIANRFKGDRNPIDYCDIYKGNPLYEVLERGEPYPFGFAPTLNRTRLSIPATWKKPRNIFVCSMADLFGEWVPDSWIKAVFEACEAAPQHRYLFLTKNPKRYQELAQNGNLPDKENYWFGTTLTGADGEVLRMSGKNCFLSIEPIMAPFKAVDMWKHFGWVIIGAETGNRKGKVIPKREWVESIVNQCRSVGTPVFLKSSLLEVMEGEFIQEYPWEVQG